MPSPLDIEDTIVSSIEDSEIPLEEPEVTSDASVPDLAPEPTTTDSTPTDTPESVETPVETAEVASPAAKPVEDAKVDDFEKRFGIPQNSASGRENRIPYSRVKKITSKAEAEAEKRIRGEFEPKVSAFETEVKTYKDKVSAYEAQLTKISEFEQVMDKSPEQFLTMLYQRAPQYRAYLQPLFEQPATPTTPAGQAPAQPTQPVVDDMPQPDEKDAQDNVIGYSMAGLAKLQAWNREKARQEALSEVDKQYGDMRKEWESHRLVQQNLPRVNAQIDAARKWPQFNENEAEITAALQRDINLTLEGAYNKVVVPKLVSAKETVSLDRAAIAKEEREKVLAELKKAPRATSATAAPSKPASPKPSNRSVEDIIAEQVEILKGK